MNNDMVNNNKPHINTQNINNATCAISSAMRQNAQQECDSESMDKSMEFLGTLGQTYIKRSENKTSQTIRNSIQMFLNDPLYVENYVGFCDDLVEKGYDLDDAIEKTDVVFEALKDKNIYS